MAWEVVVIGAGPGGSATAKKCAEYGQRTLLVEKNSLPRNKVCSGLQMGQMCQSIIQQEFGETPKEILTSPAYLSGFIVHLLGVAEEKFEFKMPLAWRKDLDYWMNQKAQQAGATIWEKARFLSLSKKDDGYLVKLKTERGEEEVTASWVIGADGGASAVRGCLFPDLKIRYVQYLRECYPEKVNLATDHYHFFCVPQKGGGYFWFGVHHKEGNLLLETMAPVGTLKEINHQSKEALRGFGFNPDWQSAWRDGGISANLYRELFSGEFLPAKGNVLLVGDAGSFTTPVTGEGIGTAIRTGLWAAEAIKRAFQSGEEAAKFYLADIEQLATKFRTIYQLNRETKKAGDDSQALWQALRQVWQEAWQITY